VGVVEGGLIQIAANAAFFSNYNLVCVDILGDFVAAIVSMASFFYRYYEDEDQIY
jgi:hypothetical protein